VLTGVSLKGLMRCSRGRLIDSAMVLRDAV
jgi:hypothetical protein